MEYLVIVYTAKTVPEMTYNVFSGTLNPTHFTSFTLYVRFFHSYLTKTM